MLKSLFFRHVSKLKDWPKFECQPIRKQNLDIWTWKKKRLLNKMLLYLELHKKFDHIAQFMSNIHTNTWRQKCKTTISNLVSYIFSLCTVRSLLTIKRPVLLNDRV